MRFTEAQLKELGFNPDAQGELWSKDDLPTNDPEPQAAVDKHDEREAPLAEKEDQGRGEESIRYSLIVHSYRTNAIDFSNFSVKQLEDMLSEPQGRKNYGIGIFPDDSPAYCDQPIHLYTKVKKGDERTEIEVLRYEI